MFKLNPWIYQFRWELIFAIFFLAIVSFIFGENSIADNIDREFQQIHRQNYCNKHPMDYGCKQEKVR